MRQPSRRDFPTRRSARRFGDLRVTREACPRADAGALPHLVGRPCGHAACFVPRHDEPVPPRCSALATDSRTGGASAAAPRARDSGLTHRTQPAELRRRATGPYRRLTLLSQSLHRQIVMPTLLRNSILPWHCPGHLVSARRRVGAPGRSASLGHLRCIVRQSHVKSGCVFMTFQRGTPSA